MAEVGEIRLQAERAAHSYDDQSWQFRDLSFTLRAGQVLAVLGPNGRGKSTLLRVAAGLQQATEGGLSATGSSAMVPQDFARVFPYRTLDMVLMGRARHVGMLRMPGRADQQAAREALALVGLSHKADHGFDALSGGERQMVLIARAIASEPATLLLDEPASALDLRNQDRVLGLVRRLADQGLAVMLTTHQPNHALAVADTALLMLPDAPALFGPCCKVLTEAAVEALYGLPVKLVEFDAAGSAQRAVLPVYGADWSRS